MFLSVRVEATEVILDPGATSAMGSAQGWGNLDAALYSRLGFGFSVTQSKQSFRSANGAVDPGLHDYTLEIPLLRRGNWTMYVFRGTSVDCGHDPNAQTPILFPSRETYAFGLLADFESGDLRWKNVGGLNMRARICESGHYAFNFVNLVETAWKLYETKNGYQVRSPPK